MPAEFRLPKERAGRPSTQRPQLECDPLDRAAGKPVPTPPVSALEVLRDAIRKRLQVSAMYGGKDRHFCTHVLGYKNGSAHCLVYQFAGESGSNPIVPRSPHNWRCFEVAGLSEVRPTAGPWHTDDWDFRSQTCVDEVIESASRPSIVL